MKKLSIALLFSAALLVGCSGNTEDSKETTEATSTVESTVTEENKEVTYDKDASFSFTNATVNPKSVTLSEEDGEYYATLKFSWINDSYKEETKFVSVAAVDAMQTLEDETVLEEVSGAYADTDSDVHFPNAVGGEWTVELKYKLVDKDSPVVFTFVPMNDVDKTHSINVQF